MLQRLFCCFVTLLLISSGYAQSLTITGEVATSLTLPATELTAMPHTEVMVKDRDGNDHRYSGIPLIDLLKKAGASVGSELRGKNLTKYLVVKAADGYAVVFALPELDPTFATRTILLADQVDGAALPAETGPYRVIVPDEKKPARWIRQVTTLEVRVAN